jgi:hypothetical protein
MNFDFFKKGKKLDPNARRRKIKGIVRCECKKHKCQRFSSYYDYLCDDCYHGKVKCHEDQIKVD